MKIKIKYIPVAANAKRFAMDVFGHARYEMFPEVADEFNPADFKNEFEFKMEQVSDEGEPNEFEYVLELPYGFFDVSLHFCPHGQNERKPLPETEPPGVSVEKEPEPISAEQQREEDRREEEENKRKEQEARAAQRKLEEQKAKEAHERHKQLIQQEENTLKMDTFWQKIDLSIHPTEEDVNVSLSILSLYYLTLTDYFSFYAALQP